MLATAMVVAVGSAFTTKQVTCISYPQYHKVGSSFVFAGEYGYNYYCLNLAGTCTYYKPNPSVPQYYPCRVGVYQAIQQ